MTSQHGVPTFALIFGLAAAACASACSDSHARGSDQLEPIRLHSASAGKTVDVKIGQDVEITLGTVGPSGVYTDPMISPAGKFEIVSWTYAAEQNPGGPTQVLLLEAIAPGAVHLSVPHEQLAPGGLGPSSFELDLLAR